MKPADYGWWPVLAVALAGIAPAQAQYPGKPLRLIVPFSPGGGTDTLGRVNSSTTWRA